jgi:transposase InsO family protein
LRPGFEEESYRNPPESRACTGIPGGRAAAEGSADKERAIPSRLSPPSAYYTPIQRLQILKLKAARRWSVYQTAKTFLLNEQTIFFWMKRIDEEGERALIRMSEPVNRFPDFVRAIVHQLKVFFPGLGKVKIAQVLARAGLHLGATTVGRMFKEEPSNEAVEEIDLPEGIATEKVRIVTAKYPGHVFHVDLTAVPTSAGFWVSWFPFTLPQSWPFCWWVTVVIDHFSRYMIGFAVFKKKPTSLEVRSFLGRAFHKAGIRPRHIISDKDGPFYCPAFKRWCRRRKINPRFGAVGKHGSIAVIERFIRSMKNECTQKIRVPFRLDAMRRELTFYVAWYNEYRPHTYLDGRTPREVYKGIVSANTKPRIEPRSRWPRGSPCAAPQAKVKGRPGAKFVLTVAFMENRKHLPVVELQKVA